VKLFTAQIQEHVYFSFRNIIRIIERPQKNARKVKNDIACGEMTNINKSRILKMKIIIYTIKI